MHTKEYAYKLYQQSQAHTDANFFFFFLLKYYIQEQCFISNHKHTKTSTEVPKSHTEKYAYRTFLKSNQTHRDTHTHTSTNMTCTHTQRRQQKYHTHIQQYALQILLYPQSVTQTHTETPTVVPHTIKRLRSNEGGSDPRVGQGQLLHDVVPQGQGT